MQQAIPYRSGRQSMGSMVTPPPQIPRSVFDRSLRHSTTLDAGWLVPMFVDEILPGDTVRLDATFFARLLSPLEVPALDELILDAQGWFCPFRLLQDNWVKLMGEKDNPSDHNDYLTPKITAPVGGWARHSLADYFGIRTGVAGLETTSQYHRAYYKIYNDHYRDENLQDSLVLPTDDGPDTATDFELQKRGKRKDYVTGSLPFVQKGDPVAIPIGTSAPVIGTGAIRPAGVPLFDFGGDVSPLQSIFADANVQRTGSAASAAASWNAPALSYDPTSGTPLTADLTAVSGININDFRELVATQHLLERDARGGTRYVETLKNHFAVNPEDSRLQRAEFLWSTSATLATHVIAATSNTEQAQLGGYMQTYHQARGFTKSFTEHGALMILVSVRAPLRYQQNIPRFLKRNDRFDYYWPDFALLGEQPVYNYEVYADGTAADDDVFGYQPRYEEYRRRENMISGALRSDDPLSLDVFHLAQNFTTRPALNSDFIEENPPVDRITAVNEEAQLLVDANFKVDHVRPMPMLVAPGLERL